MSDCHTTCNYGKENVRRAKNYDESDNRPQSEAECASPAMNTIEPSGMMATSVQTIMRFAIVALSERIVRRLDGSRSPSVVPISGELDITSYLRLFIA